MSTTRTGTVRAGRRPRTSAAEIAESAMVLFADRGFDAVSVDEIADAAGIARRTFFRYFDSKNAVAWGDFDGHLAAMRTALAELPADISLAEGLRRALIAFNTFPAAEAATHRLRMQLILTVPALQAHSMLMHSDWRQVIAEYTAARLGLRPSDHVPRTVAWLLLGVATSAYEAWLDEDGPRPDPARLRTLLDAGMAVTTGGLSALVCPPAPLRPTGTASAGPESESPTDQAASPGVYTAP